MDSLNFIDHLKNDVGAPLWGTLTGLFDLNGRLGIYFIVISYCVAYLLYRQQKRLGYTQASSFWRYIGGKEVLWHPSARLDYLYLFVRSLLNVWIIFPLLALLAPHLLHSEEVQQTLIAWFGTRPAQPVGVGSMLFYGLLLFLASDLAQYLLHRAFHGRWLWEFHKVHHSAVVMVPATASRIHLVEKLAELLLKGFFYALISGTAFYFYGSSISGYTLLGVGYLTLIFNALAANLRHTHIWLSFGPVLEHIFNSPAQHQIHHSRDPRHFNRNFGTNLSLWDWCFGTLYVTTAKPEPLEFGVGPRDNERYLHLTNIIVRPFIVTAQKVVRLVRPVPTTH